MIGRRLCSFLNMRKGEEVTAQIGLTGKGIFSHSTACELTQMLCSSSNMRKELLNSVI
jgi:hypothetical protein